MMKKILVLALLLASACFSSAAFAAEADPAILSAIKSAIQRYDYDNPIVPDKLRLAMPGVAKGIKDQVQELQATPPPLITEDKYQLIRAVLSDVQKYEADFRTAFRFAKVLHPGVSSSSAAKYSDELRYLKMRSGNIAGSFERNGIVKGFAYLASISTLHGVEGQKFREDVQKVKYGYQRFRDTAPELGETEVKDIDPNGFFYQYILSEVLYERATQIGKKIFGEARISSSSSSHTTWRLGDNNTNYNLTVKNAFKIETREEIARREGETTTTLPDGSTLKQKYNYDERIPHASIQGKLSIICD